MPYNRSNVSPYQNGSDYDDNGYYRNSWLSSMERDGPSIHDFDSDYSSERTGTFTKNPARSSSSARRLKKNNSLRSWEGKKRPESVNSDPPTLPRRTLRGAPPPTNVKKPLLPQRNSSKSWMLGVFIALSCTSISIILLATSFGTNQWINTVVDRQTLSVLAKDDSNLRRFLKVDEKYRNNNRGLFKTCYEAIPEDNIQYKCVSELGYELSVSFTRIGWGSDYKAYNHVMRLLFISLVLALVFCLITLVVIISGCMRGSRRMLIIGLSQAFLAFVFICMAMGSFHGADNYERNRLLYEPYPADWPKSHPKLATNYSRSFGYSYFLVWVAATLSLVSVASLIISYISLSRFKAIEKARRKRENVYQNHGHVNNVSGTIRSKMSDEADTYYTTSSHASRNFAYEMVEKNVPPPDELDCIDEIMFEDRGSTKL